MSLAIYLTDTLYFYPQGSLLFFSIMTGHFFCSPHYFSSTVRFTDQWHGNSMWDSTCLHPDCLSCPDSFCDDWPKLKHKNLQFQRPHFPSLYLTCWKSHGWFGKLWLMFYGEHGPQCYSISVIFHQTWTQSLTTGLGIYRYSSRGCFSLLHQSCLLWFLFVFDPKLFCCFTTSASM